MTSKGTVFALTLCVLAGCAAPPKIEPLAESALQGVRQGRSSVVLFRINTAIDGKDVSQNPSGDTDFQPRIYIARLSEDKPPSRIPLSVPSEKAYSEGWRYLALAPGTYYMLVLPPGVEQNPPAVIFHAPTAKFGKFSDYKLERGRGGFWSSNMVSFVLDSAPPEGFRFIPGFWFEIPKEAPVVYVGSISASCTGGKGLLGSLIATCSDYEISVDRPAAERVLAGAFPTLGPIRTEPMAVYGKPRDGRRFDARGPIEIVTSSSAPLGSAFTGEALSPSGVVPSTIPAVNVFNLLVMGTEHLGQSSARRMASQRDTEMKACIERLAKTQTDMDYRNALASQLEAIARSDHTARGQPLERLNAEIVLLRLREGKSPQDLALELGVRLRMEPTHAHTVSYETLLVSGEPFPAQDPFAEGSRLFQRLVPPSAQSHPVSEWCGTGGAKLLSEEVGIALKHIAEQVRGDLD
jgi:hypothetical protein